jgi:hypothetical protein
MGLMFWLLEVNISSSLGGRNCEFGRFQNIETVSEMFNLSRDVSCDPAVGCVTIERYD